MLKRLSIEFSPLYIYYAREKGGLKVSGNEGYNLHSHS